MTHRQKMQAYLMEHHVAMGVDEFVLVTSNIYHAYEAQTYDTRHLSIEYSKKYWQKVTDYLSHTFAGQTALSVLDFGCGTGFATERLLRSELNPNIGRIICYDLSADMVNVCAQKFAGDARVTFFADASGRAAMLAGNGQYDVIVCNSLMHHILEPDSVFALVAGMLKPGGIFIMGHEPNKSFYENRILQSISTLFRIYKRINRKLFPGLSRGSTADIAKSTHEALISKRIVPVAFPPVIIPKFVDIHVPMSNYNVQPWGENGFDLAYVNQYLNDTFDLVRHITYSHIKDQQAYEHVVWRSAANLLSRLFPLSGADAIFVFRKKEVSGNFRELA